MRLWLMLGLLFTMTACGNDSGTPAITEATEAETEATANIPDDPLYWLEEVQGEKALTWVEAQNARSIAALKEDKRFERNFDNALEILTSAERIPYGSIRDGLVYNFWQDDANPKGIWRRTALESYASDAPDWEILLDIDALSETEGRNWVYKGVDCFSNDNTDNGMAEDDAPFYRCLVALSDGGKDAAILREFDMNTLDFVEDGFRTEEAKQGAEWLDANTLLLATDWAGDGATLTESGYPSEVKIWTRGAPLSEATLFHAGAKTDVGVWPMLLKLKDGSRRAGTWTSPDFFTRSYHVSADDGSVVGLPVPLGAHVEGLFEDRLLITMKEDWTFDDVNAYKQGDLLSLDLAGFLSKKTLSAPEIVFRPNARQAITGVGATKNGVLMSLNDNVVGKVLRLVPGKMGWSAVPVTLPGSGQADIVFSDADESLALLSYEGLLTPESLLLLGRHDTESIAKDAEIEGAETDTTDLTPPSKLGGNTSLDSISTLKSLPSKFKTTDLEVSQKFAKSTDGTEIPYFLIHKKGVIMNGSTPTILYGYGGFEITIAPSYSPLRGKLWLEQGGAYAIANIRGGGEFGPAWHQAGLKTKRQIIYDDFIAVAEALIDSRLTAPDKLGIIGRSNGGLLMGVMITQRPDLFKAVDIGVPLLDMLRYHKLLAGASWIAEYGDPDITEERAFLESISPYHNFNAETDYPTPFFYTSTKDDRVHPGHARKFAKLFEDAGKPFLYYENTDGGHAGAAKPETLALRIALEYTYFANQLAPQE